MPNTHHSPGAMVAGLQKAAGAWRFWALALVLIGLDQITKIWANTELTYDQPVVITSFFNLTLRYNYGAAFSFLYDASGWQRWMFAIIATVVSIGLVVWISRISALKEKWLEAMALACILSGAVGNLIDRVVYGYVIDFIEVHYQNHFWPAFNIADSAICVGAGLLILDMLLNKNTKDE